MKKIIEKLKRNGFFRNCVIFAPILFVALYFSRKKYVLETVEKFAGSDIPAAKKRRLMRRVVWNKVVYHFDPAEYFLYELDKLNAKGKRSYVADEDHISASDRMNRPENKSIFEDKIETYRRFGEFYGRDVCVVTDDDEGKKVFAEFTAKHPRFMAKPQEGSMGSGINIYDVNDYASSDELHSELFVDDYWISFVAEEIIVQTDEMAKLNPSSVNTFRIPTYRFDDRTEIRYPRLRIGQNGSIVDNAGAGGILALIDEETGIIYSAVDESKNSYVVHPDSGVQLVGYKVPHWEEIKEFAKKLAQVVPDNRYTGWDIALTDKGCVLVEANSSAQFGHQIALKKGFREELESIIEEMNINN